jgi:hypothetical protein
VRTLDRPLPTITLDPDALASWPVRPVIAIESSRPPPWWWDGDVTWDQSAVVWDGISSSPAWIDATCDFTGCEIAYDPPDDDLNFPAGHCVFQLDNRSGRWAAYNVDGSPTDYGPGLQVWIWADEQAGSGAWWLFAGRVARWDEQSGDVIEVEAFDFLSDLAQPVGTYTPGAAGDLPGPRLSAITPYGVGGATIRTRYATGVNHLTAQITERAPLEEMQVVAQSDGGVLYGDSDGTVVFADRFWRAARPDQTTVPVVATNVCGTGAIVLWDPVLSTQDTAVATTVVLENVAGLKSTATHTGLPYQLSIHDQQWTTQLEGDQLAAVMVEQLWQPRVSIAGADLYLLDPAQPTLWQSVDWRRGDRIRLLHDSRTPGGVARVDVELLIIALAHAFTPDGWVMSFGTTRALTYYTRSIWDGTDVWDSAAVWGY